MTDEMIELFSTLPRRLRARRIARRMSQQRLAELSGVGSAVISSYETGARIEIIKLSVLGALAGALGTTVAELIRPLAIPSRVVNAFEEPMRMPKKRPRAVTIRCGIQPSDYPSSQSSLNQDYWR